MSDKPSKVLPPMPHASALAPLVYFDLVPNFGVYSGVANFTLEAVQFTMDAEGHILQARVTVAHVRTSLEGLGHLKAAIEGLERNILASSANRHAQTVSASPRRAKPN